MPSWIEDDLPLSTVEDLTPEEPPKGRLLHLREAILGVGLLFAVLLYSGYDWWHRQHVESNYRLGAQAAGRLDWDEAEERFRAVAGYKDAGARAEEAARKLQERDAQYLTMSRAAADGQWITALRAARALRELAGDYRDTMQVERRAEQEVYRQAAQGVIAMRAGPGIEPPGLYYRGAGVWVYLEGSDSWSQRIWEAEITGGQILYDVPGPGWTPPTVPARPDRRNPRGGPPELKGRRLMLASFMGDRPEFRPLAFDPALYVTYFAGKGGVWALSYDPQKNDRRLEGGSGYADYSFTYQAFGSPLTSTLDLPGHDWSIVELADDGDRYLLADLTQAIGSSAITKLYLGRASRNERRLILAHQGKLGRLRFGPDGRRALVHAYTQVGSYNQRVSVLLLDLSSGAPPRVLSERVVSRSAMDRFNAAFFTQGPFMGHVLLLERNATGTRLSVLDPNSSGIPPSVDLFKSEPFGVWGYTPDGSDSMIIGWEGEDMESFRRKHNLSVIRLSPGEDPIVSSVSLASERYVWPIGVRDDHLIFASMPTNPRPSNRKFVIYTVSLKSLEDGLEEPRVVYVGSPQDGTDFFNAPIYFGPQALAYLEDGELHARSYDGHFDVKLEGGISGLIDMQLFSNLVWIR